MEAHALQIRDYLASGAARRIRNEPQRKAGFTKARDC
jgi:hypothetical protein